MVPCGEQRRKRTPAFAIGHRKGILVRLERPLTSLICLLIVIGAWAAVPLQGWSWVAVAEASAVTLLSAAVVFHYIRITVGPPLPVAPIRRPKREESAEFRRNLLNLVAALKLGIRFCEDHLDGDPGDLVEQLEQMADNISAFANQTARPVRYYDRPRWQWRLHPRWWPWRVNTSERADK